MPASIIVVKTKKGWAVLSKGDDGQTDDGQTVLLVTRENELLAHNTRQVLEAAIK